LLGTSGIGGVGKKASIRAFAFSLSDWYLYLSTDSSGISIAAPDGLAYLAAF
jgi:hypothetical protein